MTKHTHTTSRLLESNDVGLIGQWNSAGRERLIFPADYGSLW